MTEKPVIIKTTEVARSGLFSIEQIELKFSNGQQRVFERCRGALQGRNAVMVVPFLNADTIILVREYATGIDRYELTFPKGLVDLGENFAASVNRELKEEAGYGAKQTKFLKEMSTSPSYMSGKMQVFMAWDLYAESLPGDEPEPLEVVTWSIHDCAILLAREDFTNAMSIAALHLAVAQKNSVVY